MNNLTVRESAVSDALSLDSIKNQVKSLLGNNERKIESFKTKMLKIGTSYGLDKCTPESIITCGIQALTVNLPLEQGQGYVVNYGGTATFDCGYKGWQILAKRAGYSVQADVVYSCDEFGQDGFGFNREMTFVPNYSDRKGHDDKWAKENLTGVIVSIMEDETKNESHTFVTAEMIMKITGMSQSAGKQAKNGKMYSPHDNWAEQMFAAKAIKQVLSKFAIDIQEAAELHQAIDIVNQSETVAKEHVEKQNATYPQHKFEENYPKWKNLILSGKRKAMSVITTVSNGQNLTESQLEKVMDLKKFEVIEGEVSDAK